MKKLPTKIYLRKSELRDHSTQERMVSCDEPFDECVEEYININNLWHNASEEPKDEPLELLCEDEEGYMWIINNIGIRDRYEDGWKEYVECELIVRWAYIYDFLLPKGGEK